jgi:hypothetical protein
VPKPVPLVTDFTPTDFTFGTATPITITGSNFPQQVLVYLAESGEPGSYQWTPPEQPGTCNDGVNITVPGTVSVISKPPYGQGALTITVTNSPGQTAFTTSKTKNTNYHT